MVGRPFQPGQSGNPNGRPKSRPFKDALERALNAAGADKDLLDNVAAALVSKASEGDVPAIKEIADRLDGKVAQAITGGDDDTNPINILHRIERVIVDPKNRDG
jgi:hypothetical protein